jgi:hypothetical protein
MTDSADAQRVAQPWQSLAELLIRWGEEANPTLYEGDVEWANALAKWLTSKAVRVGVPCVKCGTPLVSAVPCATCRLLELGVRGSEPSEAARAAAIVTAAWVDGVRVLVRRLRRDVDRATGVHEDRFIGTIGLTVAELEQELRAVDRGAAPPGTPAEVLTCTLCGAEKLEAGWLNPNDLPTCAWCGAPSDQWLAPTPETLAPSTAEIAAFLAAHHRVLDSDDDRPGIPERAVAAGLRAAYAIVYDTFRGSSSPSAPEGP